MEEHFDRKPSLQAPGSSATTTLKPIVVVSGANLTEMGGLSILIDCLNQLAERSDKYKIVALVHKKELIGIPNIDYYEFPRSRRSIVDRLYHEYWIFWRLSRQLDPFLWLSLHNATPRVRAQRRAVYCQNATNFYKLRWWEAWMQPRFAVFNIFLDLMYRINLRQNAFVVVQQEWVRQAFRQRFGIENVIVAHPISSGAAHFPLRQKLQPKPYIFFYPSHPWIHKNYEVICDAVRCLLDDNITDFEVWLTFTAADNRYARYISKIRCRPDTDSAAGQTFPRGGVQTIRGGRLLTIFVEVRNVGIAH